MKRSVFSLVALILTFLVSVTARAGSGDVITSLSQLSQSKCYTISTVRGKMVLNTGKTGVVSSHTGGGATVNSNASTDEADGHWAIIVSGSSYYLYNVTKGEFLSSGNTFTAAHATLSISSAASPSGNYVYVIKSGASTLTNDDAGKVSFVAATTESEGTRVCITEAGDFDADAFATTSKSNLSSLLSTAKSAVSGYKTSIQDGDYYAGTDANHGLKSHYFVDGTEKTSQKGYECTQTQIDALSAAISSAETVSESSDATVAGVVEAYTKLATAKAVCDKKWDPVVDGVYFIINGFADDAPVAAQALKYGEEDEVLYKRPLVTSEPKQMFEVKVLSWDIDSDGDSIPTSAYIKNIASGKYLGGVDDNRNTFSDTPVAISWPVANTQGRTKQAHRYQFQTPTGELFNGQNSSSGCEVKTSGNYEWHRSWMFRPAEKYYQDYLANKDYNDYKNTVLAALAVPTAKEDGDLFTNSWIDGTERTAVAGFETTQERLDTLQAAWDKYDADRTDANKAAVDAAMEQVNKKWEPLTSGVYFLIPRFGDDQGNNNTQAMTYKDNAAWKLPLVKTNPAFMFEVNITSTDEDLDYGEVPVTMTIKNVATGKYLGAINGGAWEYQDDPVEWSYTTFVGDDFYSPSKHAHCFGLNINGKFITYANNTSGSALTTTTTSASAWMRAWMFRPAEKYYQEYLANKDYNDYKNTVLAALAVPTAKEDGDLGSNSWIDGTERTAVAGVETTKDRIDALRAAWDKYDADRTEANKAAVDAAMAQVNKKWEPLTSGVYFLIPRYGDDQGNNNTQAMTYKDNAAWKLPLVMTNPAFMFEVSVKSTKTDATLGEVPQTLTIKNVSNGKYLGAIKGSAWEYQDDPVDWSYTTFVGNDFYSSTKHAHCFGLNIDGKFITYGNNTSGTALTTTTGGYAWKRAWMFRPADKYYKEYLANKEEMDKQNILSPVLATINAAITPANHHDNTGTRSFLLGNEKTSVDGLATSKDALDALKAAYAVVENAFKAGKKIDELTAEIDAMHQAQAVVEAKSNPLTNGYYYLIAEYGDDTNNIPGGYAIQYGSNTSSPDKAYKKPYQENLASQIFYVEYDKSAGKVYLKNVESGKYLGKVENNAWTFVSEKTALNIVSGTSYFWYWSAEKTKAARSCSFILTNDNAQGVKCSTSTSNALGVVSNVTTGSQAWDLAWAFRPAEAYSKTHICDKTDFVVPDNTQEVQMSRQLYAGLNTVCMPFALTTDMIPVSGAKIYAYKSSDGTSAYFDEVTGVEAGQPCLVELPAGTETKEYTITIPAGTTYVTEPQSSNGIIGTFKNISFNADNYYKLATVDGVDKFVHTTSASTLYAFRFGLSVDAYTASKGLTVVLGGEPTGIGTATEKADVEAVYGVDGVRLAAPRKGINIVKMSNGKTRKVLVK